MNSELVHYEVSRYFRSEQKIGKYAGNGDSSAGLKRASLQCAVFHRCSVFSGGCKDASGGHRS